MRPPAPRSKSLLQQQLTQQAQLAGQAPAAAAAEQAGSTGESTAASQPADWSSFYDCKEDLALPGRGATFRVYRAGVTGPLLFFIHGGGYTSMSWAACVVHLDKSKYQVAAMDVRGHGATRTSNDADLSIATLTEDAVAVLEAVAGSDAPPTVLLGHSMGGAIAVHAAASGRVRSLAGLLVVDVVEGSALQALPVMPQILSQRPGSFSSLDAAIEWALASGLCKQRSTAAITVPSMLRQEATAGSAQPSSAAGPSAQQPQDGTSARGTERSPLGASQAAEQPSAAAEGAPALQQDSMSAISDDAELQGDAQVAPAQSGSLPQPPPPKQRWVWRTNLAASEPFWTGWYQGLSQAYLGVGVPKLLILADTNRLDTSLTIAQMQGKFQMHVVPQAGHAVHEDNAQQVAAQLSAFLSRQRIGEPPLIFPPKLFK